MRILIVEDDKFLGLLLEKKFKKENFDVITATDGEEAIEKIINHRPDAILLDIILPQKSGFWVLEEINKDENLKKIPVFIISNLGQPEDIQKGKDYGVKAYFVKAGLSLDELVANIKKYLGL
jgi:DNA-binding response OmpR family regulator